MLHICSVTSKDANLVSTMVSAETTTGTYRRAEDGNPVKYSTAQEILQAINSFLREKGQPEISLEDLGLTLM